MIATYVNRYGDKITFEQDGDTIIMSGHDPEFMRYGLADDSDGCSRAEEIISMIDPSGGPYLTTGSDLSLFWDDKQPRIIKSIKIFDKHIEFKI